MSRRHWSRVLRGAVMLCGAWAALASLTAPVEAKTPGKTYCFRGFCHRVLTLEETSRLVGQQVTLSTSNYDDCSRDRFNPCGLTSSGAVFQADKADNAASPIYPDGTIILVRNPKSGKSAVLRVNSAGPYHFKRLLDVSRASADVLGFKKQGVANLEVRILQAPNKAEATYKRNRVYAAVPGFIGDFASLDAATTHTVGLADTNYAIAALYPQMSPASAIAVVAQTDNGIERTWLAKGLTFKGGKAEARLARKISAKISWLEQRQFKPRRSRTG
jgi:rare lipoprotein A